MDQVPKILKPLVDEWTPDGFIVSFKVQYINTVHPCTIVDGIHLFISLRLILLCLFRKHKPRWSDTDTTSSSETTFTDANMRWYSFRAAKGIPP